MNSAEYQITIKSANQKVDDYVLDCKSNWTVQRLKQHIAETHVNKPIIEEQRLIYAGNLLKDTLTLKQVFFRDSLCTELTNSSKTDFTIHLVCAMHQQKSQPASQSTKQNTNANQTPPAPGSSDQSSASISSTHHPPGQAPQSPMNGSTRGTPSNQSNQSAQANQDYIPSVGVPPATTFTATQAAEIARSLLQSEQIRQQHAIFQQLANLVAAEIVQHLANSNNINNINSNSTGTQSTDQATQIPNIMPLLNNNNINSQPLNLQALTTTTTTTTVATQSDSNLVASSAASQMLYAGNRQTNQFVPPVIDQSSSQAGIHPGEQNLNGDNSSRAAQTINQPAVGGVGDGAPFGLNAQRQAAGVAAVAQAPPQAPMMEQAAAVAAPQPLDPDVPMMQHDVIDWVYYSIRAMILMAALYIHASFFRVLFLVGLMAIAYFCNRRSARRGQNQAGARARNEPAAAPAAVPERVNNELPPHPEAADDQAANMDEAGGAELRRRLVRANENQDEGAAGNRGQGEVTDNQAELNQVNAAQRHVSFLKLCYLIVTDFLASLVPE